MCLSYRGNGKNMGLNSTPPAHYGPALYTLGQYRIVAILDRHGDVQVVPDAYAIIDGAGRELRRELDIDTARSWMEREHQNLSPPVARPRKPGRPARSR